MIGHRYSCSEPNLTEKKSMAPGTNPRDLLTPAALHMLLSLATEELHGYGIKRAVEQRTGGGISLGPGTLYEGIHRMAGDGWIEEVEGSGRKRVYRLTGQGRAVLDDELRRLDEIVSFARNADLFPGPEPA
jgi:DNA-binding PadR family transcriptional regulator